MPLISNSLDLTMANCVHLMEPGWNPLLEQQAIDRVHRLGQQSQVIATHYVVPGVDSIEQVSFQGERIEALLTKATDSMSSRVKWRR